MPPGVSHEPTPTHGPTRNKSREPVALPARHEEGGTRKRAVHGPVAGRRFGPSVKGAASGPRAAGPGAAGLDAGVLAEALGIGIQPPSSRLTQCRRLTAQKALAARG